MSVKLLLTYIDSENERLTFSTDIEDLGDVEEFESQTVAPEYEGRPFQLKSVSIARPVGLSKILPTKDFQSFLAPEGHLSQERIDVLLEDGTEEVFLKIALCISEGLDDFVLNDIQVQDVTGDRWVDASFTSDEKSELPEDWCYSLIEGTDLYDVLEKNNVTSYFDIGFYCRDMIANGDLHVVVFRMEEESKSYAVWY